MNKTTIFTAGLASAGIVGLALFGSGVIEIKKKPTDVRCIHGFATINTRAVNLVVAPGNVAVQRGCKIILQIVPPRGNMGDVTIKHEDFPKGDPKTNSWLDATSAGSREIIVIDVPKDATTGEHKYSVAIPGFATLDPHADVIP